MKIVILAGGFGTRFSEETDNKPKPMIEIGGKPILWHIMKIYSHYGFDEFIICCGYKGYIIKEYFSNYFLHMSDVTIDMKDNSIIAHNNRAESWKVTLVDTGESSMTGGRLLGVKNYLNEGEDFCFTYGDGVSDINIKDLVKFHKDHGKKATLTAAYPRARFGALEIESDSVKKFIEKPKGDGGLINAGFFVLNYSVLNLIQDHLTSWEKEPLSELSKNDELKAFKHKGFWQPMDTLRDKIFLESLWNDGKAPWKVW